MKNNTYNPLYKPALKAQVSWLGSKQFDYMITIHFRKKMTLEGGRAIWFSEEIANSTIKHFTRKLERRMQRLNHKRQKPDRKLSNNAAKRKGPLIEVVAAHEPDPHKRLHTHLLVNVRMPISGPEFEKEVHEAAENVDWINGDPHVQPVDTGTELPSVAYLHKNGLDAFSPVASNF